MSYDRSMASRERHDPKRGRHKARRSPETRLWERMNHVPEQPSYLDSGAYLELVRLRQRLELEHGAGQ